MLAAGGYALYCRDRAYSARMIAIRVTAYSDEVRTAICVDMAPSFVKAVATDAAARKGRNSGNPFGVMGGDKEKRPGR